MTIWSHCLKLKPLEDKNEMSEVCITSSEIEEKALEEEGDLAVAGEEGGEGGGGAHHPLHHLGLQVEIVGEQEQVEEDEGGEGEGDEEGGGESGGEGETGLLV